MKPYVVSGYGVVSTLGVGRRAFVDGMRRGIRPVQPRVDTFDASKYGGAQVAEVPDFDAARYLGDKGLRPLDRLSKLLIVAARLALDDAALKRQGAWMDSEAPWPERVGLVVSNAYGSLEAITELDRVALLEDARYINPSRFPLTVSNSAAGYVSIWEELRAVNVTVSDGNCGALDAVACGSLLLDAGRADVLLVGGAEAMTEPLFVAFRRLGLGTGPDPAASGGALLGEGAVLVAMERRETAAARGLEPVAEMIGYGTSFAPPERTASLVHATPDALERAIGEALIDADAVPGDVDLVVSGRSGLAPFDEAEAAAIDRVFGADAPVAAPKQVFGETLGASGALAILAATAYLHDGAAPTALRGVLRRPVRTALVTSVGYYGNASALVMRAASR